MIAAMARNRVIGRNGELPWHVPADLKHFKKITSGHTVIMGRRTYDSVGFPLPNRRNIVVTRSPDWKGEAVDVAHGLEEAIEMAAGEEEIFILGGEQIYEMALPLADRIYLTRIDAAPAGDAHFPEFEGPQWIETPLGDPIPPKGDAPGCRFLRYDRAE